ncbi:NAD(P)-binding protein [Morchella conica CCBAS932]|uniref:NAD(P)-binding protein n=1 Tax=Morchella conica CCBAS932 TaxID=1392247 RepID=A0A3N4KNN6_9PEZI|nr:NAD(P)-binding protein [Morchella conica CCBAS932]
MKVAVAGTAGLARSIGTAILEERRHEVVILSRYERPDMVDQGFIVIRVDYQVPESLVTALSGVDTVISTVSKEPQLILIDACITAGVRRFAPAEFEGVPSARPIIEPCRDRITTLNRLREVQGQIQPTVFSCGFFYEWFYPGGLINSGASMGTTCQVAGFGQAGSLLADIDKGKARIPVLDNADTDIYICLTAVEDVGRFVARCLDIEDWPDQLRMCGERLTLSELVKTIEEIRGQALDVTRLTIDDLNDKFMDAEEVQDSGEAFQLEVMMAVHRGEFDFPMANVNKMFPKFKPIPLKSWLQDLWGEMK